MSNVKREGDRTEPEEHHTVNRFTRTVGVYRSNNRTVVEET